jgi:autotransporter-associated beta strand protein
MLAASPGLAATRTWLGGGANSLWSTAGNWSGGLVPVSGDLVVISASATTGLGMNDLVNLSLAGMGIERSYSLFGNAITIGAGGIKVTAPVSGGVQIAVPLQLSSDQTWWTTVAQVYISSSVALNSRTITFEVENGALLRCGGAISGTGQLIKIGEGDLRFDGNNAYVGRTRVDEGYLIVGHANGLGVADGSVSNGTAVTTDGTRAGTLQIDNVDIGNERIAVAGPGQFGNSALQAKGTSSIAGPVVALTDIGINVIAPARLTFAGQVGGPGRLRLVHDGTFVFANSNNTYTGGLGIGEGGDPHTKAIVAADEAIPYTPVQHVPDGASLTLDSGITQTLTGVTGQGTLRFTNGTSALILSGSGDSTFAGALSGSGVVRHTGTGHQQLTGNLTSFSGEVVVDEGQVTVSTTTAASGHFTANAGGVIAIGGATDLDGVTLLDGTMRVLAAGEAASTITTANFAMTSSASQLIVETTSTGQIGRLQVSGDISLAGTLTMPLAPAFSAPPGTVFTLMANGGADPVSGTFANLSQGATFTTGLARFQIAYDGGDGNDVTLTLIGIARDYLLSEGAIGGFFTTEILIANPNDTPAPIRVSFLKLGGGTVDLDDEVPAMTRKTIVANDVAALDASEFSTLVRSLTGLPLIVERTMTWDRQIGYGAHTEHATDTPSTTWYFAEGSQGFFSTFLLLANPNAVAMTATVDYLREGEPPVTRTYDVPALSRRTIDAGTEAALVTRSFGMVVTLTQPGFAERAMYFGRDPLWRGGHASAGVTKPSATAFIAEGATGSFFKTFILIANPQPADVNVALTFLRQGDTPIEMSRTVAASSRLTLNIETLDPGLANAAVATSITASAPVIVERAQYWPNAASQWYEAHGSPALQAPGTKWGLAEGRVGGGSNYQTYILLANVNTSADAHVSITFLRESGAPFTKTFTVLATRRLNVWVGGPGTDVPELVDERFGALITSDQPIAVERAMYADAGGQIWAAGTSATATPVP